MLSWLKRLAAPLAALAAFAVVPSAKAEDVRYYVTGTFNGNAAVVAGNQYQQSTLSVSANGFTSAITYRNNSTGVAADGGTHSVDLIPDPIFSPTRYFSQIDLGSFFVTSNAPSSTPLLAPSFSGNNFTLTIIQQIPTSGQNTTAASLNGVLVGSASSNASGSSLRFYFNPLDVYVPQLNPTMLYSLTGVMTNNTIGDPNFGKKYIQINAGTNDTTTLNAEVTAVPLPGVAMGGLWLLGGIGSFGGLKALRRRSTLLAA
jgi:hypothetical protein